MRIYVDFIETIIEKNKKQGGARIVKTVMFASIFAIFLLVISPVYLHAAEDENIMSDAFLTTLSPHIANAIAGHYGKVVQHALYDIEIISIERTKNGSLYLRCSFESLSL